MREILFRGKDPETGTWYEGFYMALSDTTYCFKGDYDAHPDNTKHYIVFDRMTDWGLPNQHLRADADPSTVGQYTGKTDKNKKRVFDGDIIRMFDAKPPFDVGVVQWDDHDQCYVVRSTWSEKCHLTDFGNLGRPEYFEVIGNIHDNPELLKGGED